MSEQMLGDQPGGGSGERALRDLPQARPQPPDPCTDRQPAHLHGVHTELVAPVADLGHRSGGMRTAPTVDHVTIIAHRDVQFTASRFGGGKFRG
jgi:hypothetical protein